MRFVTHCPNCSTSFKVVADQLRIAQGWVRCGHCQAVYKAYDTLSMAQEDDAEAAQEQPAAQRTDETRHTKHNPGLPAATPTPVQDEKRPATDADSAPLVEWLLPAQDPDVTLVDEARVAETPDMSALASAHDLAFVEPTLFAPDPEPEPAAASEVVPPPPATDAATESAGADAPPLVEPPAAKAKAAAPAPEMPWRNSLERIAAVIAAKKAAAAKATEGPSTEKRADEKRADTSEAGAQPNPVAEPPIKPLQKVEPTDAPVRDDAPAAVKPQEQLVITPPSSRDAAPLPTLPEAQPQTTPAAAENATALPAVQPASPVEPTAPPEPVAPVAPLASPAPLASAAPVISHAAQKDPQTNAKQTSTETPPQPPLAAPSDAARVAPAAAAAPSAEPAPTIDAPVQTARTAVATAIAATPPAPPVSAVLEQADSEALAPVTVLPEVAQTPTPPPMADVSASPVLTEDGIADHDEPTPTAIEKSVKRHERRKKSSGKRTSSGTDGQPEKRSRKPRAEKQAEPTQAATKKPVMGWFARKAPAMDVADPATDSDLPVMESQPGALPNAQAAVSEQDLSFIRKAQRRAFWHQPKVRAVLALATLAGLVALGGQMLFYWRSSLYAQVPLTRVVLDPACRQIGCTIPPWQHIESFSIDSSNFRELPNGSYRLSASLRNTDNHPVAMPALELVLLNPDEQVLVRRVIHNDAALPAPPFLPPRGEWNGAALVDVKLPRELRQQDVAGYRLNVFYP